jgi:hypothetical protein
MDNAPSQCGNKATSTGKPPIVGAHQEVRCWAMASITP